jgi:hypothetical protein
VGPVTSGSLTFCALSFGSTTSIVIISGNATILSNGVCVGTS